MEPLTQPAAIHVDLDGAAEIYEVHGWRYGASTDALFESGLRRALQFFAANRIPATLFVIGRQLNDARKLGLLREAVRQGHEIASHTMTHRSLVQLGRDEKRREIFDSRRRLADTLGVEVRGFRAPAFHIDRESLDLIAEAGYGYDSSLFPTAKVARKAGVEQVRDVPHRLLNGCGLIELSLPSAAPLPFPFHPCFSLVLGSQYFRVAFRRFRSRCVPLVFLFHLTDFADPLPAADGWASRFYTLSYLSAATKQARCQRMLDAVRLHFQIVTGREFLARAAGERASNGH